MPITKGMMSSNTDLWATPQKFFDKLDAIFHFTLDVCATKENAKCPKFYTKEQDGLKQPWRGTCFMNPPYGRSIQKWVKKAYESAQQGATVVCLLPARTDTRWFQDYCLNVTPSAIHFIRGRLHFNESRDAAPFPSCIVVFSPETLRQAPDFSTFSALLSIT